MNQINSNIFIDLCCPFCDYEQDTPGSVKAMGDGRFSCQDCGSFWRDLNPDSKVKFADINAVSPAKHSESSFKASSAENSDFAATSPGTKTEPLYKMRDRVKSDKIKSDNIKSDRIKSDRIKSDRAAKPDDIVEQPIAQAKFDGKDEEPPLPLPENATLISAFNLSVIAVSVFAITLLLMTGVMWFSNSSDNAIASGDIRIENVSFKRSGSGKQELVRVNGTMVNRSSRAYRVPKLRLVLKSQNAGEVMYWTYESAKPAIEPGEELNFSTLMGSAGVDFDVIEVAQAN